MKLSTRLTILCALFGSFALPATEPKTAPEFSRAPDARVRSLENYMAGTTGKDRDERLAFFIEALRDDPAATLPRNRIWRLIDTRADARKAAPGLLEIARANPKELGLATLAGQMCYAANQVPAEYLDAVRATLDAFPDPTALAEADKNSYYSLVGVYSAALKQMRDYRTGSRFFEAMLDNGDDPAFREMMFRFAIDFEHYFTRLGSKESRWLGLADTDREAAKKRFEQLFSEYEARPDVIPVEDLDRYIDFCLAVGKPQAALRAAKQLVAASAIPQTETRLGYVAIAAEAFDLVPPIVEKLSGIDGWKGVSQLLEINSLLGQEKYAEAKEEIAKLKVPIARDEFMLKVFEAQKDYKGMRDQLAAMEKSLSPGVEIDLANALRQIAVAEKLRDAELLNRIWKLLIDTEQIESSDAANSVGYVAAELNIRLDEAEKLVVAALDGEPDNYAYLDSLAWVYFRQGKLEDAERYMRLALRASEQELFRGVLFEHLGDILLAQGKKSEALKAYREALDYTEDTDFDPAAVEKKCRELE